MKTSTLLLYHQQRMDLKIAFFSFRSNKIHNIKAKLQGETGLTCSVQALNLKCDV